MGTFCSGAPGSWVLRVPPGNVARPGHGGGPAPGGFARLPGGGRSRKAPGSEPWPPGEGPLAGALHSHGGPAAPCGHLGPLGGSVAEEGQRPWSQVRGWAAAAPSRPCSQPLRWEPSRQPRGAAQPAARGRDRLSPRGPPCWSCPHACPWDAASTPAPHPEPAAGHAPRQPQSWRPHGAAGVSRRLWGAGLTSHLLWSPRTPWGQLRRQDPGDSRPAAPPPVGITSGAAGPPKSTHWSRAAPRLLAHSQGLLATDGALGQGYQGKGRPGWRNEVQLNKGSGSPKCPERPPQPPAARPQPAPC